MSTSVASILLSVLTVALGGGTVQLVIFLLRRRADVRNVNTSSDVNLSTAAMNQASAQDKIIGRLQDDAAIYREQVRDFQSKISRLEDRHEQEQRAFAEQLRTANSEITRLTTRVAQLQTDLAIANRQLADWQRRDLGAN